MLGYFFRCTAENVKTITHLTEPQGKLKKMRHVIYKLLFILLLLWGLPAHATTNVGTAGAQFLKIGPGARVDSLGGAFGALANDVTSIYWNPAGISQLEKTSFFRHTYRLACRCPV